MGKKGVAGFCVGLTLLGLMIVCAGAQENAQEKPSAFFPAPVYTFEPVFEGVEVPHGFVIQNKGTKELEVKRVEGG